MITSNLMICGWNFRYGSQPAVTASQHWRPVLFSQQTPLDNSSALAPERFGRQAAALATPKGRRIAPTCTCVHVLPRAVLTLRSLSLTAMWTTTSSHVCRREHLSGVCLLCLPLLGRCYGRTIAAMIMLNLRKLRMNE